MYVISTAIIIIINKINALNHMVFYQFIDTQKRQRTSLNAIVDKTQDKELATKLQLGLHSLLP